MTREATGSVLALMTRVLRGTFGGETWAVWRAVLTAAFALALTDDDRAIVEPLTGRHVLPAKSVRELWLILGRRSGKSIIAALIAVWSTCCRAYTLAPGEVGVFMVIASDRRQARVIKRYIAGLLRSVPTLAALLDHETAETIWLTNGLCIEIHTCSFRSLRGYTCIGAAVDEVSFWSDENSADPDHEVLVALRAAMSSVPEAMLVAVTTPYAKRGEVGRVFDAHFAQDTSDRVLVVNGPTVAFNPTISQAVIDAAYVDDPIAAASEYGGAFRSDVERLIRVEVLDAVVIRDRHSLPPAAGLRYEAFVDPSGGSGTDAFTLAIGHVAADGRLVLDALHEQRPPCSPEATVADFCAVLKTYRIATVTGDRYAGEWPREQFRKHHVEYRTSDRNRSELYLALVPALNSGQVELLDQPRLLAQLAGLERRTARGGKDAIDHAPGRHDDLANAAAGVLVQLAARSGHTMHVVQVVVGAGAGGANGGDRWANLV